jgi:hypothetical protein
MAVLCGRQPTDLHDVVALHLTVKIALDEVYRVEKGFGRRKPHRAAKNCADSVAANTVGKTMQGEATSA